MRRVDRLARAACAALAAASAIGPVDARQQPTQPIYVQYDGFVRNRDGTLTIAFGYYNLNGTDVTIQPGDANAFAPAPVDRSQPVVFRKGRHRFACGMVVDQAFDGRLQWTVRYGGKTSTSTAKTLDPLYELEANSEERAVRGIDVAATATRGVCLNRSPHLEIVIAPFEAPATSNVELQGKTGQELAINARVEDDGLPRSGAMTSAWKKTSGPGDVTFSDAAIAATRVRFSAPGDYGLELSATDGEKSSTLKVSVHVEAR